MTDGLCFFFEEPPALPGGGGGGGGPPIPGGGGGPLIPGGGGGPPRTGGGVSSSFRNALFPSSVGLSVSDCIVSGFSVSSCWFVSVEGFSGEIVFSNVISNYFLLK